RGTEERKTVPLHPAGTRLVTQRPGTLSRPCLDQLVAAAGAQYIVASGSLPPGVPDSFYARVAALACTKATRFVLDTSSAALKQAGPGIYLLKSILGELADLTGREIRT